jgi:hypothetical protein
MGITIEHQRHQCWYDSEMRPHIRIICVGSSELSTSSRPTLPRQIPNPTMDSENPRQGCQSSRPFGEQKNGLFAQDIIINVLSIRRSSARQFSNHLLEVVKRSDRGICKQISNGPWSLRQNECLGNTRDISWEGNSLSAIPRGDFNIRPLTCSDNRPSTPSGPDAQR